MLATPVVMIVGMRRLIIISKRTWRLVRRGIL
jgi:hypothetical protein